MTTSFCHNPRVDRRSDGRGGKVHCPWYNVVEPAFCRAVDDKMDMLTDGRDGVMTDGVMT